MRLTIGPNLAVTRLGDAIPLAVAARRLVGSRCRKLLESTAPGEPRDRLLAGWARQVIDTLQIQIQIKGLEHIEPGTPYVILPLHEGLADAPAVLLLPAAITFVARADLAHERPMNKWIESSGQILINPDAASSLRTIIRETVAQAAEGRSVAMFAQGTVLGIETAFHPGVFKVADAAEVPILPVVLTGSHRVWEHPFSATVRRGQTMYMEVLPAQTITSETGARALERKMKARALDNTWAPPRRYVPGRDGFWDGYRFDIDPDFPDVAAQVDRHRREMQRTRPTSSPSKRES